MKKLIWILLLAANISWAGPKQSVIFGSDWYGRLSGLPPRLCVYPDQMIRLQGDVYDRVTGKRFYLRAENFGWRLTWSNGWREEFRVSQNLYTPHFNRDPRVQDAIQLYIPRDIGRNAYLELGASFPSAGATIDLVDAAYDPYQPYPAQCEWGPPEMYEDGVAPNPVPAPGVPHACGKSCFVGSACTDACPTGAICRYRPGNPSYWQIDFCP